MGTAADGLLFIVRGGRKDATNLCRVKTKDAAKHMKMYKKLPQQRIIQPKMPIVLRVRTSGLRGCFRRTFAWAGECCPRSSGKGGIVRSGPRSVTSECPVSCLGTVPRSGRRPYALHRSSLTAERPGWPGRWEDRPMARPSQGPPQPGSAFSWRPNLLNPLVFSFTFTP